MKQSQVNHFFKKTTTAAVASNGSATAKAQRPIPPLAKGQGPSKRDHSDYESSKRCREFKDGWKDLFDWVRHDKKNNVMYCEPCREFQHIHPVGNITLIKGI